MSDPYAILRAALLLGQDLALGRDRQSAPVLWDEAFAALDNLHADVLGMPFPPAEQRRLLGQAVIHLLDDHDCDHHGWETWRTAALAAVSSGCERHRGDPDPLCNSCWDAEVPKQPIETETNMHPAALATIDEYIGKIVDFGKAQETFAMHFGLDEAGDWSASLLFGREAPDSPMVSGASYGYGKSLPEALKQIIEECRL